MNRFLPLAAVIVVLAAIPAPRPADATTGIARCEASDGTIAYTDLACSTLDATHTPIEGELLSRIVSDEARATSTTGNATADTVLRTSAISAPGRRSLTSGCARSTTQLEMDLHGSLALGDINRLAESYHWAGLSHRDGRRIMDRLDGMFDEPLTHSHFFNAYIGDAQGLLAMAGRAGGDGDGDAGTMQLMFGRGTHATVTDFRVERYRDCYFIRY
ncbi:hypothetical protein [Montanilutibacter psychrotolerans]|uniref:DUF4124 domain-containing protein n=1 Tax=Montanilutibacter psychrotolerans TaxID=1327343 RepID=A0A3M8SX68_9GAMM|nr:hypothetical protein [Lysobacter psychrotolerans]RNF85958.1 hypothetical protein EER27_00510 [Lysobacter psychrotolerans]